ncbi:uncharacterized protein ColSpa_12234 [Colletotrichum spaethianum]|uniref:Uncharacterized protein n=1 Tax=Colletotrichum spaethianum TaxID=700344 RepID=A0AA37UTI8_9PEZI|nr:uncharacterized protein ColSpa_12234 [Colletotrichum spaethianum]GKT52053.1 hypothetical protein ColSpa_12234 [Colletotrichum spaethianum]
MSRLELPPLLSLTMLVVMMMMAAIMSDCHGIADDGWGAGGEVPVVLEVGKVGRTGYGKVSAEVPPQCLRWVFWAESVKEGLDSFDVWKQLFAKGPAVCPG